MTKPQQNLPSFLVKPQRMDLVLYGALIAVGIFSFALMPFRAVLLNDYTLQNVFLTGGSFSVLKLSAENPDRPVSILFASNGSCEISAAPSEELESPTFCSASKRSIQLSYEGLPFKTSNKYYTLIRLFRQGIPLFGLRFCGYSVILS